MDSVLLAGTSSADAAIALSSRGIAACLAGFADRAPLSGKTFLEQKGLSLIARCAQPPVEESKAQFELALRTLRDLLC
jgi:hypothetical protein